jgi:hypothetical protein
MSRNIRVFAILLAGAVSAEATIDDWWNEVDSDTQPAATLVGSVSGSAPQVFHVGTLSEDRSFEFIVNAGVAGMSSALMGNQSSNGSQGLKFEQWQETNFMGMTNFGVVDLISDVAPTLFTDTHIVFTSDNVDTSLYVNGTKVFTFFGFPLLLDGDQGIAATFNGGGFTDALDGEILGFASYDSALSDSEVKAHYDAFIAVPEPSTLGIAAMAGIGLLARRRRPVV